MALHGSLNLPARGCGQAGPLTQVAELVRSARAAGGRHQPPAFRVHCSATFTSNVKLPATHVSSSSLALQQLALSSGVNSAFSCLARPVARLPSSDLEPHRAATLSHAAIAEHASHAL